MKVNVLYNYLIIQVSIPNEDLSKYVPICAGGGLDMGSPGTPLPEAPAVAA